ncbi:MAG: Unknown protein [uncultured Sulfurovum sp.]|uniref:Uncharacterized protein n=1 Tax=uncultured Sulfurovum sp. TaxID=269237 RepID=A0A6S6TVA0_9BACT|nr:MAG: Unknown protein [uncultured Sulfurovum sp.]
MINDNEAWIEDCFMLKDSEKFKVMIKVYENIFVNKEYFANKIGMGRSTVFNWLQKENASFNTKSKTKICQAFNLLDTVWRDSFSNEKIFEKALSEYEKIISQPSIRVENTLVKLQKSTKVKQMKVDNLSKEEMQILLESELEKKSAFFLFELSKVLQQQKEINEALRVLMLIESKESTFRYTHENQIRHQKAILLSSNDIKDWDTAIHILRSLYHSTHYHLKEPEILTLLASNYKRKALVHLDRREEVDMALITSAICLYEDAYHLKADNHKYYDAINLAYLYNLVDVIEIEYADKKEIETLYAELLRVWRIDTNNWWEVCSDAEFLMLLGKVDLAILKLNSFLEKHKVEPFELAVTIRQLKLYIEFTEDQNAKAFLDYLRESVKYLNLKEI